jgi:hypothetical protein
MEAPGAERLYSYWLSYKLLNIYALFMDYDMSINILNSNNQNSLLEDKSLSILTEVGIINQLSSEGNQDKLAMVDQWLVQSGATEDQEERQNLLERSAAVLNEEFVSSKTRDFKKKSI